MLINLGGGVVIMADAITFCEDCEHMIERSKHIRYSECQMHPRLNDGFVSSSVRVTTPYLYCKDVNGGACCLFSPKKDIDDGVISKEGSHGAS